MLGLAVPRLIFYHSEPLIFDSSLITSSSQPIVSSSPAFADSTLAITTSSVDLSAKLAKPAKKHSSATEPEVQSESLILISDVPFIIQAPLANWSDPLQENGCEEASVLMAIAWARGLSFSAISAEEAIIAMGEYQLKNYGQAVDTNAADTVERLFVAYWDFSTAQVHNNFSKSNLISNLQAGKLIIMPVNGRLLKNPYFTPPGPTTHMLVVIGYDPNTDEFITHDPGTRRGESYRYSASRLLAAAVDYPTGNHEVQDFSRKTFISVSR